MECTPIGRFIMNVKRFSTCNEKIEEFSSHFQNIGCLCSSRHDIRQPLQLRSETTCEIHTQSKELPQTMFDHIRMLEEFLHKLPSFLFIFLLTVRDDQHKKVSQFRIILLDKHHRLNIFNIDPAPTTEHEGEGVDVRDIFGDALIEVRFDRVIRQTFAFVAHRIVQTRGIDDCEKVSISAMGGGDAIESDIASAGEETGQGREIERIANDAGNSRFAGASSSDQDDIAIATLGELVLISIAHFYGELG